MWFGNEPNKDKDFEIEPFEIRFNIDFGHLFWILFWYWSFLIHDDLKKTILYIDEIRNKIEFHANYFIFEESYIYIKILNIYEWKFYQ